MQLGNERLRMRKSTNFGSELLRMRKSTKGIVLTPFTTHLPPSTDTRGRCILAEHNCDGDNYAADPICVECNSPGSFQNCTNICIIKKKKMYHLSYD